ncbi:MAG: transcription factor FapR [Sporomusaceae bacterium]|nr:transcription factor FapR [Sporomusaceae bacterium]
MMRTPKKVRQAMLQEKLREGLFLTDEDLAAMLGVSVQTIRLDRLELGIPELRERTRQLAHEAQAQIRTIASGEVIGELIDLELGQAAISLLNVTPDMVFARTKIARGHYLFAQANSLALALIDAPTAVTGVANVKFKTPVYMGAKLIAKAEVVKVRGNKYFVWVKTRIDSQEVFRAKFILVSLNQ